MKICVFCGKPCQDSFRVVEVEKNQAVGESNLCQVCGMNYIDAIFAPKKVPVKGQTKAATQKINVQHITSAAQLFAFLLGKAALAAATPPPSRSDTHSPCPKCGHTLADLQACGKFGCGYCYKHFDDTIVPVVDIAQRGGKKHVGKVPKNFVDTEDQAEKLKILKLRMARAIEFEKYEDAAKLKDQIRELETKAS